MVKAQSLAMATINDELHLKTNEFQMQLALANILVDVERAMQ